MKIIDASKITWCQSVWIRPVPQAFPTICQNLQQLTDPFGNIASNLSMFRQGSCPHLKTGI
jgi:hypothetical protein